jgi:hypothetical protein
MQVPNRIAEGGKYQDLRAGRLIQQHLAKPQQLLIVTRLDGMDHVKDAPESLQVGVERIVQGL